MYVGGRGDTNGPTQRRVMESSLFNDVVSC